MRIDAAPALESVRLEWVFPSKAAPLLAALASDPNLPALQMVELTMSQEDNRNSPHPGPLAPLADGLRRALEQRAGGAAAGAAVSEWRVEVAPNIVKNRSRLEISACRCSSASAGLRAGRIDVWRWGGRREFDNAYVYARAQFPMIDNK